MSDSSKPKVDWGARRREAMKGWIYRTTVVPNTTGIQLLRGGEDDDDHSLEPILAWRMVYVVEDRSGWDQTEVDVDPICAEELGTQWAYAYPNGRFVIRAEGEFSELAEVLAYWKQERANDAARKAAREAKAAAAALLVEQ